MRNTLLEPGKVSPKPRGRVDGPYAGRGHGVTGSGPQPLTRMENILNPEGKRELGYLKAGRWLPQGRARRAGHILCPDPGAGYVGMLSLGKMHLVDTLGFALSWVYALLCFHKQFFF